MPTINSFYVSTDVLRQTFAQIITTFSVDIPSDLPVIFEIGLRNRSLFPNINLGARNVSYKYYLEKWLTSYLNAWNNPPSTRIAKPKDSCSDPALKTIVQIVRGIDESEATRREKDHNLFMSAENAQGSRYLRNIFTIMLKTAAGYGVAVMCFAPSISARETALICCKSKTNTTRKTVRVPQFGQARISKSGIV